jgi:hypothetical protein
MGNPFASVPGTDEPGEPVVAVGLGGASGVAVLPPNPSGGVVCGGAMLGGVCAGAGIVAPTPLEPTPVSLPLLVGALVGAGVGAVVGAGVPPFIAVVASAAFVYVCPFSRYDSGPV